MAHQAVHRAVYRAAQAVRTASQNAPNQAARLVNLGIEDLGIGIHQCMYYANERPDLARLNPGNYAHFIVNRARHD